MSAPQTSLGVLGGMGPAATAEFLRLLAELAPATRDQDHPRILLLSNPGIPDRSDAVARTDNGPVAPLRDGLHTLVSWGAGLLAVPCNTAHVYLQRFTPPAPLVDIVDATLAAAAATAPAGAWLTASAGTVASGLYTRQAAIMGYPLRVPDQLSQGRIDRIIKLVKANRLDQGGWLAREAVLALWEHEPLPVIAACTELPLAYARAGLPAHRVVSSLEALATDCIRRLYARPRGRTVA